ncbi:MAG: alpha/beta hydrolase, partial [Acidobacteria bacterium]|nr:alpha/beta hydrolase [Acidobacteriota bacterium]
MTATEYFVEFRNRRGKRLRGMIHRPAGTKSRGRVPGVVFFHGFTGDRMESHWIFIKCARALARAGIASLRFDFYGSGESEGEFHDVTLGSEIADAVDAVKFFRRQKGIDATRVGLCGLSLGGLVAAAIAHRARVKALVLWSALARPELLRSLAASLAQPIPGSSGAVEYDAREISPRFLASLGGIVPLKLLARYRQPTLIIHPEKDQSVPASHAEDFFLASGAPNKQTIIVDGADHTFNSLAWERDVIERTVA